MRYVNQRPPSVLKNSRSCAQIRSQTASKSFAASLTRERYHSAIAQPARETARRAGLGSGDPADAALVFGYAEESAEVPHDLVGNLFRVDVFRISEQIDELHLHDR